MAGHRVKLVLAVKFVEAAEEGQQSKTIARYGRVVLLCIDELLSQESAGDRLLLWRWRWRAWLWSRPSWSTWSLRSSYAMRSY